MLILKYHCQLQGNGIPGEINGLHDGAEKIQGEPGESYSTRK
jgi:hypothetical protein